MPSTIPDAKKLVNRGSHKSFAFQLRINRIPIRGQILARAIEIFPPRALFIGGERSDALLQVGTDNSDRE